jgi:hypothetical protein
MTRLTAALQAAADEPADLDLDAVHTRVGRRRRRRVRARAGACAVGALVVVAGIGLAAGAGDRGADVRAGEPEGPGVEEPTSEPVTSSTEEPTTESTTTSSTTEPVPSTEEPTTTTTEAPSTTEAPPSTTAPAPTALHMEWTYAGDEQWRLGRPECPDLTHWLDAAATGSDGSAWTMRQDYCGHNDGQRWEGEGTLSLAGASGTLSGRMTSSAPMPTTGVPYSWTVGEGTGDYVGATGECVVTVHLTDKVFGGAHHEGTITCDLTLGGGAPGSSEAEVPGSV